MSRLYDENFVDGLGNMYISCQNYNNTLHLSQYCQEFTSLSLNDFHSQILILLTLAGVSNSWALLWNKKWCGYEVGMYYKQEGFHTSTNLPFTELTPDYSGIAYWLQVLLVFNYFYLFFLLIMNNRWKQSNYI